MVIKSHLIFKYYISKLGRGGGSKSVVIALMQGGGAKIMENMLT